MFFNVIYGKLKPLEGFKFDDLLQYNTLISGDMLFSVKQRVERCFVGAEIVYPFNDGYVLVSSYMPMLEYAPGYYPVILEGREYVATTSGLMIGSYTCPLGDSVTVFEKELTLVAALIAEGNFCKIGNLYYFT